MLRECEDVSVSEAMSLDGCWMMLMVDMCTMHRNEK